MPYQNSSLLLKIFLKLPLSLSLSLSSKTLTTFSKSMAGLFRSSLLPPPPQPAMVLSFLSLTDPLSLSHNLLKLILKWFKLSLSLDSLSHELLSLSPKSVSLSLSSLYLSAQWCMLIYGFVVYVDF